MNNQEDYIYKINTFLINNILSIFEEALGKEINECMIDGFKLKYLTQLNKENIEEYKKEITNTKFLELCKSYTGNFEDYIKKKFDFRTIIDLKKLFKPLIQQQFQKQDHISFFDNLPSKNSFNNLFLQGGYVEELDNIKNKNYVYDLWNLNNCFIQCIKYGIIHYQALKFYIISIQDLPQCRNFDNVKKFINDNKPEFCAYVKYIKDVVNCKQLNNMLNLSLYNESFIPERLMNYIKSSDDNLEDYKREIRINDVNYSNRYIYLYYLLHDFFKDRNNKYLTPKIQSTSYPSTLDENQYKKVPLSVFERQANEDLHPDQRVADMITNTRNPLSPKELPILASMLNFYGEKAKQGGGMQYGGSHIYEHIFNNLKNKLASHKVKVSHKDEKDFNILLGELKDNEQKIVEGLKTLKSFSFIDNIQDFKDKEVSLQEMYDEIMKNKKDSVEKEDKLMRFINKLNIFIKEHFKE